MPSAVTEEMSHSEPSIGPQKSAARALLKGNHLPHDDDHIPSHPLGVKPLGNQYLSSGTNAKASAGTWATLPDEIVMLILEQFDKLALLNLGHTSKYFHAFCHSEELWKALFLQYGQLPFYPLFDTVTSSDSQPEISLHNHRQIEGSRQTISWRGSWKRTVLGLPEDLELDVDCGNVFSDVLHRPFACSNIKLSQYASRIPKANQIRRFADLTYDEFAQDWTREPFVLSKCIRDWPVTSQWTIQSLLEQYGDVEFRAEAVDWSFKTYCKYMAHNSDESPLYLFDKSFAEKMKIKVGRDDDAAYWRPECFGPDFFEVLGDERPAHRWLIVGPERSGSTFHKDPNGTSAWNAVIQGAKYWIMFPPSAQVPGVYVSEDSSEVTSPLSIAEWLLTFHEEARQLPECVEGICEAGEILHVPSGWWHLVVNLESGIALTQNFVPQSPSLHHLAEVLAFLRDKPDQVSGFGRTVENPFELFTARLKESYSEQLEKALDLADRKSGKKRKWDAAVAVDEEQQSGGGGFSFGFGGDDEDEIP